MVDRRGYGEKERRGGKLTTCAALQMSVMRDIDTCRYDIGSFRTFVTRSNALHLDLQNDNQNGPSPCGHASGGRLTTWLIPFAAVIFYNNFPQKDDEALERA
jgi:hypothetical protein